MVRARRDRRKEGESESREKMKRALKGVVVVVVVTLFIVAVLKRTTESVVEETVAPLAAVELPSGKEMFEHAIRSFRAPVDETLLIWAPADGRAKLCAAIVELRKSEFLQHVLWNMAGVYGGSDVCLYVFHGTGNSAFVRDIVRGWENVQLVNVGVEELSYPDGINTLMLNASTYRALKCEFVLFFQTDSIIRRRVDSFFFKYKYVGAPWIRKNALRQDRLVGNGGFSLRHVATMIEIAEKALVKTRWEDQYIVSQLDLVDIAPEYLARQFCVDNIFYPDPVGIHKPYNVIPRHFVEKLLFG